MLSRVGRISRDSLIYGVGGTIARYTGFILLPIYTRVFSPDDYGILQSVTNLTALLLAVTSLGLDGAAALLYFATEDDEQRRRICTLWVWLSLIASLPITLLLWVSADWTSQIASGSSQYANLFRIGLLALPFSLLQATFGNILRLSFRPRRYAILNFSLALFTVILSVYFVVIAKVGLVGALWGMLLGTALSALAGGWMLRDIFRVKSIRGSDSLPTARRLLKLGLPLVPAGVALWIISFSSTYFLIRMEANGPKEAGVYRAGAQLAAILGLGIWAFQLAWGPYSLSIAKEPDAPRTYSRVATLYTAGAVGASVLMAAIAPILLSVFATGKYAAAASVIGMLALGAAALGAYYVVALGVNLAHRTGQIAWTTLVAAALNLTLNALLIPVWGVVGAGLASLAANLTSTALVYSMSQRYYPLPYRPLQLLAIWLFGGFCIMLAGVFNMAMQPSILLSLAFAAAIVAVYALMMFALGVVKISEVRLAWTAVVSRSVKAQSVGASHGSPLQRRWNAMTQRPLWPLVILTVLAFALRVGFMVAMKALNAPPTDDALEYHNLALNMLAGNGYSLDGAQIVNRAPAYPTFLAGVYAIFGQQVAAVRVIQALLISLITPMLFYVGKRGWNANVGMAAAVLFAIYPFSIFWSQYMITENLLVVLFVALAALLVRPQEAGPLRLLGAGVFMGLSLLTRPTALPVIVLLFVWLLFAVGGLRTANDGRRTTLPPSSIVHRPSSLKKAPLLLIGLAVAMSPWIARNYAEYGQFIPFTSGYGSSAGGYVFWISNNALTAKPGEQWGRYVDPALLPEYAQYNSPPNDPSSMDRKGYQYGLNYLKNNPGDAPMLILGKFLRFWNVFPGASLLTRGIGALALLLLPFFLVGQWRTARDPAEGWLLLSFIVGTMLVGLIFWADTRTRAPTEPFILLASAVGVVYLVDKWKINRR